MTTHAIVYDPDCGFCRVCVAVVLKWDRERRLRPVALRSTEADRMLAGMPEDEQMASWHLVEPGWQRNVAENATNLCHLAGRALPQCKSLRREAGGPAGDRPPTGAA